MIRRRLPPQTGWATVIGRGETLRIVDPEGEQVADLISFSNDDPAEWLSSGRTLDYGGTIYPTRGDVLWSNRSRPMWTILEDDVGRHDFLLTPCSPEMFRILYGTTGPHASCFQNLAQHLEPLGIAADAIPTTFNVFMNVVVGPDGRLEVRPPLSKAGDAIVLRAEMDLIVGVTACSAELSNNRRFKPIDVEVRDVPPFASEDRSDAPATPASA